MPSLLRVERADPNQPVDAALGAEVAVGGPAVDGDGDALDARFLALGLVEDLGGEAMALGPAEVHPEQHLRPIGGLRTAGTGADRHEGVAVVVFAAEQQVSPSHGILGLEVARLAGNVVEDALVGLFLGEVEELERGLCPRLEVAPEGQLLSQTLGLAQDSLGGALIVPESGHTYLGVETREAALLGGEVKDAPRSPGSA